MVSVRHTGTRLVRDHLLKGLCINRHIGEKCLHELEIDNNLVIPLRRLENIIVSWERRGMELPWLQDCLRTLVEYDALQPYYLPIDADDRDDYLARMNEGLGLNVSTDWPVISDKGSHKASWDDVHDQKTGREILDEFAPFFGRFYGRNG